MILIANWKMYLSYADALALARGVVDVKIPKGLEVVLCPSATALAEVKDVVGKKVSLGGQNAFWEEKGAYTGEVSCTRLKELGCRYVILGHSERREHLGETDTMINKKVRAALAMGLTPILCVGETVRENRITRGGGEKHRQRTAVGQLIGALEDIPSSEQSQLLIAYEPVWAIGTGEACEPEDAKGVREEIVLAMTALKWKKFSVLYGGSVDANNITDYITSAGFDGVLVGGASTKKESLLGMIEMLRQ